MFNHRKPRYSLITLLSENSEHNFISSIITDCYQLEMGGNRHIFPQFHHLERWKWNVSVPSFIRERSIGKSWRNSVLPLLLFQLISSPCVPHQRREIPIGLRPKKESRAFPLPNGSGRGSLLVSWLKRLMALPAHTEEKEKNSWLDCWKRSSSPAKKIDWLENGKKVARQKSGKITDDFNRPSIEESKSKVDEPCLCYQGWLPSRHCCVTDTCSPDCMHACDMTRTECLVKVIPDWSKFKPNPKYTFWTGLFHPRLPKPVRRPPHSDYLTSEWAHGAHVQDSGVIHVSKISP